jgi:hypothetical protein
MECRSCSLQGVPLHTGEEDLHGVSGSAHDLGQTRRTGARHALRLVDEQKRPHPTGVKCTSSRNEIVLRHLRTFERADPRDHVFSGNVEPGNEDGADGWRRSVHNPTEEKSLPRAYGSQKHDRALLGKDGVL